MYLLHGFLLKQDQERIHGLTKKTFRMRGLSYDVVMLIAGLGVLAISAKAIVGSAEHLIASLNIPTFVFGLILLSLGTNLPELALALQAALQRKKGLAFADFLGSSAANTLILGGLALYAPFTIEAQHKLTISLALLLGATAYFLWAVSSGKTITRKEGFGLLFFYAAFLLYEMFGP